MASNTFQTTDSANDQGVYDHHADVFPLPHTSTSTTFVQDPILNSSFDHGLKNIDHDLQESDNLIDPDLMETSTSHPSPPPAFNDSYSLDMDPPLDLKSNLASCEQRYARVNQRQPFSQFLVSKATHQHHHRHHAEASTSARAGKTNGRTKANKPSPKVTFVDPMHPHAHLAYTAVFCCQIPVCTHNADKAYKHSLIDFIKHYSKPTVAAPLYDVKKSIVPQADNPDQRAPMLILTDARIYKVEKLGENSIVRLFVCDITHENKYWELFRGGAVDQLGWIDLMINKAVGAGKSSTWKCKNHGDIWQVSILDKLFEHPNDASPTSNMSTPTLGTGYDSGYTSSSVRAEVSPKKGHSVTSDTFSVIGEEQSTDQDLDQGDDQLTEDPLNNDAINEENWLAEMHAQALVDLELGDIPKQMMMDDTDELADSSGLEWADDLLDEVNLFINEHESDNVFAYDFDSV
ncbi:hypothetical protein EYC80_008120 [Monilinia laxa]|uniref:Uncharacterized protein n=1 Tax=Monilinia laxa TaxID=61186 RepID=A0A5N6JVL3_MONLA|nr:hypothetical protein EYC80_008120 [Monilinia laxa]